MQTSVFTRKTRDYLFQGGKRGRGLYPLFGCISSSSKGNTFSNSNLAHSMISFACVASCDQKQFDICTQKGRQAKLSCHAICYDVISPLDVAMLAVKGPLNEISRSAPYKMIPFLTQSYLLYLSACQRSRPHRLFTHIIAAAHLCSMDYFQSIFSAISQPSRAILSWAKKEPKWPRRVVFSAESDEDSSIDFSEVAFHAPNRRRCRGAASGCSKIDPYGEKEYFLDASDCVVFLHDQLYETWSVHMQEEDSPIFSVLKVDLDLTKLIISTYESTERREERAADIDLTSFKDADVNVLTNAINELLGTVKSGGGRPTQLERALSQHPNRIAEELWTMINSQSEPAEITDAKTFDVPSDDREV